MCRTMTPAQINQRYKGITTRSFQRHMDLFLTAHFLRSSARELSHVSAADYKLFQPSPEELALYLQSHQAKSFDSSFGHNSTIRALDDVIKQWWKVVGVEKGEYEKIHRTHHCISHDDFEALFSAQTELACKYCGITENQFKTLIDAGQIQTKRLRNRGTTFEIDCREPSLGYTKDNLAICCYWCNNAKTDEFTEKEFKPVAKALGLIWQQRLSALSAT